MIFGIGFFLFFAGIATAAFCGLADTAEPEWVKLTAGVALMIGPLLMLVSVGIKFSGLMP